MRLILLGPPGSGKGTQGDLIEDKFGFPKVSAGDLLREAVEQGTPLGLKAKKDMNKGDLVKDSIIIDLIKQRIHKQDCKDGYTLDGFPRNISQAESLEKMDSGQNEIAIDIKISDSTAVERISSRYICTDCNNIYNIKKEDFSEEKRCDRCGGKLIQRKDDKPEVIKKRLYVYHKKTEKLIDYYRKKDVYRSVNGESSRDRVFKKIRSIINQLNK
ncbi:MAG: adenylate kinase [Candidatus Aminicenantes bacterium]